ncbi:MAG: SH3 domain-containing protein [Chloroflexota bacterium]
MRPFSAITRSLTNLYETPDINQEIIEVLKANLSLKIISEENNWVKVRPLGFRTGWVTRSSVLIPEEDIHPFTLFSQPDILTNKIPSIPSWVKPNDFIQWLGLGGRPNWIAEAYWSTLTEEMQRGILEVVKKAMVPRNNEWNTWLAEIQREGRFKEATLDEWFTILNGGKKLWTIWQEKLYRENSSQSEMLTWATPNDIITWTGHIRRNQNDPFKTWYEISVQKKDNEVIGWFRNPDLLDEYKPPMPENDPAIDENAERIFDFNDRILYIPTDKEIGEAVRAGFSAAQYIDLVAVTGRSMRHFNLCGIFSIAALGNSNVIPTIKRWLEGYPRAKDIIFDPGEGTGTGDLKSLLTMFNLNFTNFDSRKLEDRLTILSPKRLHEKLLSGYMLVAGVSIKSNGRLSGEGNIRHWVVVEDAAPVGNSGWVRLYNSFHNADEVYTYKTFSASFNDFGTLAGVGIWVEHPRGIQSG